jgi:hypothetical protein
VSTGEGDRYGSKWRGHDTDKSLGLFSSIGRFHVHRDDPAHHDPPLAVREPLLGSRVSHKGLVMSENLIRDRYEAFFAADFMPLIRHAQTQGAEERIAYAAEFAAFQLGQIDKKLSRLIEILEMQHGSA